jgi:hypothetical protein
MIRFRTFLTEASSLDNEELGHLSHVKDIPHEDPSKTKESIELLKGFHQHKMGKGNKVTGQLKVDGGASVVIGHDDEGTFVSDKHRHKGGTVARTHEEVDKVFGKHPQYAEQLKNVLDHAHKFVNPGHTIQGDLMFTEHDKSKSVTPNRITYGVQHGAKIGLAAHTEITNGVAHVITPDAIERNKDVFIPQSEYKPNPSSYRPEDQKAAEQHIAAAEKLIADHTTEHLTPDHVKHFTSYVGRSSKEGKAPTVEGYRKFLLETGAKEARKLKTVEGQKRKIASFQQLSDHVSANAEHFQRTIDIRHHLGAASEAMLKDVYHPDMTTKIDNKFSPGEGIVLLKKNQIGVNRPVAKLVPETVSHAIRNNPRFA